MNIKRFDEVSDSVGEFINKEFSEYAVFNCAQQHRLHERVDDGEIEKILKEESKNK